MTLLPRSQTLPCPWAPCGNGQEGLEEGWNGSHLGPARGSARGRPSCCRAGSVPPAWVLQRALGLLWGWVPRRLCPLDRSGHCPLAASGRLQHVHTVRDGGVPAGGGARLPVSPSQSGAAGWAGSGWLFFLCFNIERGQETGVWASWPTDWGIVWGRFFCLSFFACQMGLTPLLLSFGGSAASGERSKVL